VRAFTVVNNIAAASNVLIWCGFTWLGRGLINGVTGQNVTGYPNTGQLIYYLRFPLVMAACTIGAYAVSRFTRYKRMALAVQFVALLVFLPFLLGYTGGM
jgi:hypothetical protein